MTKNNLFYLLILAFGIFLDGNAQTNKVQPTPAPRQLKWHEAEIQLEPQGLGKMNIQLSIDQDQKANVQFVVQQGNAHSARSSRPGGSN